MRANKRNRINHQGKRIGDKIRWQLLPYWIGFVTLSEADRDRPMTAKFHSLSRQLGYDAKGNAYFADPEVRALHPDYLMSFAVPVQDREMALTVMENRIGVLNETFLKMEEDFLYGTSLPVLNREAKVFAPPQ